MEYPVARLIEKLKPIWVTGELPNAVYGVTQDSRMVRPGFVFFLRTGFRTSGSDHLRDAIDKGASLVVSAEPLPVDLPIAAVNVADFRPALVSASHSVNGDPSSRLSLMGVTGTNGKTSTVHLFRSIIEAAGEKCAMLTTVGYWTGREMQDAALTTPDIDRTCAVLGEGVDSGCTWGAMEVSSHALDQGRTNQLKFRTIGFSHLTRDHLDYHHTFEDYFSAKLRLFKAMPLGSVAAVNIQQPWGARVARAAWGSVVTVGGENSGADLTMAVSEHTIDGATYRLNWQGKQFDVQTSLIGLYQGENLALAASMALGVGYDPDVVIRGVRNLRAVPGRMEAVTLGQQFAVLVDYSHTPDALRRAILSLRSLTKGKLVVVFGCGGDRDRTKRPLMGQIAAELADRVFITSDNPRTEDPAAICGEIAAGIPKELSHKATVIANRREATQAAIQNRTAGDVVLLAGKGSETYLEVNGHRTPYDDRIVAAEALEALGFADRVSPR